MLSLKTVSVKFSNRPESFVKLCFGSHVLLKDINVKFRHRSESFAKNVKFGSLFKNTEIGLIIASWHHVEAVAAISNDGGNVP